MKRVVLLASIWGWSFFFVKIALRSFGPFAIAFSRTALGCVAVLLVGLVIRRNTEVENVEKVEKVEVHPIPTGQAVTGRGLFVRGSQWRIAVTMGILGNAVPFALQSWAQNQKAISSSLASVLNASTPLCTALVGVLGFRMILQREQLLGLALGFTGVVIASGVLSSAGHTSASGVVAMLGSVVSYGAGFNIARKYLPGIEPLRMVQSQQLVATIALLPFALSHPTTHAITVKPVLSLILLGAVGTGLAWVINLDNVAKLGAAKASSVTFLVPIVAFALGIGVLKETLRTEHVIGAVITFVGVAMVQQRLGAVLKSRRSVA